MRKLFACNYFSNWFKIFKIKCGHPVSTSASQYRCTGFDSGARPSCLEFAWIFREENINWIGTWQTFQTKTATLFPVWRAAHFNARSSTTSAAGGRVGCLTMNTLTKMSSSRVSEGTVVHLSSKASSLYSSMDTEKFPSSVLSVMVLRVCVCVWRDHGQPAEDHRDAERHFN